MIQIITSPVNVKDKPRIAAKKGHLHLLDYHLKTFILITKTHYTLILSILRLQLKLLDKGKNVEKEERKMEENKKRYPDYEIPNI